jgi:outer membrane protein W
MQRSLFFSLLFWLTTSMVCKAQDKHSSVSMPKDFTAFSWEVAIPTDNKYLTESSLSGWRLEYRRMIKENLSIGVAASWNAFNETLPTKTYSSPGGATAITTDMIRQVYTVPITLITHYYFATSMKLLQPFLGIGLGGQYAENNTYFNIYQLTENNWGFVARPELGATIHFGQNSPLKGLFSAGYNWSTNKNEGFDIDNWSHLTINVGIGVGSF